MLADDLVVGDAPELKYLMDAHAKHGGQWVSVQNVPMQDVSKYGIIQGTPMSDHTLSISSCGKTSQRRRTVIHRHLGSLCAGSGRPESPDTLSLGTAAAKIQITGALCDLIPDAFFLVIFFKGCALIVAIWAVCWRRRYFWQTGDLSLRRLCMERQCDERWRGGHGLCGANFGHMFCEIWP